MQDEDDEDEDRDVVAASAPPCLSTNSGEDQETKQRVA